MARNKTLFVYNGTNQDQSWRIYSDGVIDETFTINAMRRSFTINLSGDANIQFGVNDTVYLNANYKYDDDSWDSNTDTPNEMNFSTLDSGVTVTSNFDPTTNDDSTS